MLKNKIIRTHLFQMLKGENVDFPFYTGIELSEMGKIKYMVTRQLLRRVSLVEQEPLNFQGHLSSIYTPGHF